MCKDKDAQPCLTKAALFGLPKDVHSTVLAPPKHLISCASLLFGCFTASPPFEKHLCTTRANHHYPAVKNPRQRRPKHKAVCFLPFTQMQNRLPSVARTTQLRTYLHTPLALPIIVSSFDYPGLTLVVSQARSSRSSTSCLLA